MKIRYLMAVGKLNIGHLCNFEKNRVYVEVCCMSRGLVHEYVICQQYEIILQEGFMFTYS